MKVCKPVDGRSWRIKESINFKMILIWKLMGYGRNKHPSAIPMREVFGRFVGQQFAHRLFEELGLHILGWLSSNYIVKAERDLIQGKAKPRVCCCFSEV
jgi:hypothetical protein